MTLFDFFAKKQPPVNALNLSASVGSVTLFSLKSGDRITVTPELAEKLARELPNIAAIARRMEENANAGL